MSAPSTYELTVIIPVYNAEAYLPRNLDSLICQQADAVEILVVDDGSPGNCAEIVALYQARGHDIHYVKHPRNLGLMHARMTGMREAAGRFVLHIDADDMLSANAFSEILRIIQDPDVDMITYSCKYGPSLEAMTPRWHNHPDAVLEGEEIRDSYFERRMWWMLCSKVFSKELCQKASAFWPGQDVHINSNEDLLLFVPLLFAATKCVAVNSFDYLYFATSASMTKNVYADNTRWEKICADMGFVRRQVLRYLKETGRSDRIDDMEESMHVNFVWLEEQAAKLPDKLYTERLQKLVSEYDTTFAYRDLARKGFAALCHGAGGMPIRSGTIRSIGIFSEHLGLGGAERVAALLASLFTRIGFQVVLFTDVKAFPEEYQYPQNIPRVILPPLGPERNAVVMRALNEHNVDACILVSHHNRQTFHDAVSCRWAGRYVIQMEHSMFFYPAYAERPYLLPLRHHAYHLAHALTCLSEDNVRWWRAAGYDQAVYLPNPLTFGAEKRNVAPREERKNNILFLGKLYPPKGLLHFVPMLHEVRKYLPDATLTLLGRWMTKKAEEIFWETAGDYGLTDSIDVPGHVSNVDDYYKRAAVHILPSPFEGAPMTLMEAKAFGTPSVLFEMEYLACSSEKDGCLFAPQNDPIALSRQVVRLLENSSYWEQMSQAAFASLVNFSEAAVMDRWNRLFLSLQSGTLAEDFPVSPGDPRRLFAMTMREFAHSAKELSF